MAYTKQNWIDLPDESTPLSAARLNHIEDGIESATQIAEAVTAPVADDIPFTPTGSVSSTDVQAAIMEVVADFNDDLNNYVPKSGTTMNAGAIVEFPSATLGGSQVHIEPDTISMITTDQDAAISIVPTSVSVVAPTAQTGVSINSNTNMYVFGLDLEVADIGSGTETIVTKDGKVRLFGPIDGPSYVTFGPDETAEISWNDLTKELSFTANGKSLLINELGSLLFQNAEGIQLTTGIGSGLTVTGDTTLVGGASELTLADTGIAIRLDHDRSGFDAGTETTRAFASVDGVGTTSMYLDASVPESTLSADDGVDTGLFKVTTTDVLFNNESLATESYVDTAVSGVDLSSKVSKSGDTMSGPLVIEIAGSSTPLVVRHDSNGEVQVAITQTAIEFDDTAGGGFIVLEKNASDQLTVNGDAVATEDYVDAVGFDGLTDVDPIGKVSGSIFHWDAVDGTYNPSPLNVASDGTTDLVASQDTDVLRLHIGSSPAGFSVSASNDGEDTSQQLQVNATGVYVNALLVATEAAASGIAASAVSTHAGATDPHGDRAYADGLFASNDALLFKGVIDCSANPDYPAASAGHTYKISVAGKLGGASGVSVEVGDTAICAVDNTLTGSQALVGANWFIIQANLDGAVTGPASSTSGNVATFSGTGGKVIQDSGVALGNAASKNVGTTAGTVAAGDDSRLSDTRTPSDDSVTSAKIVNGSVANADMADMAAKTVKMRHTNSTGAPEDTSMANLLADLSAQAGADFSFNAHKVTGVTEGAAAGEAATYAATPAGIVTAKGDLIFGTGSHTAARSAAPTNNKFWCADSNQSNGFTAVDLPWLQKVDVLRDLPYSATGFASQLALAGNYAQMTALNDEAVFYLQFGAGTWSFNCWRTAFSSYGILTCSIDGTTIATLDNYSSGSINPGQSTTTGISITVPGVYAFKIKTTSKNASSSGYNQRIWGLSFTRTA